MMKFVGTWSQFRTFLSKEIDKNNFRSKLKEVKNDIKY